MSEEQTDGEGGTTSPETEFEAITISTQEDLDKLFGKRVERERAKFAGHDDYKAKAEQYDALEAEKLSELEKERATNAELRSELDKVTLGNLRSTVATEKKLPARLASRLSGGTKEEMEKDADEMLEALAELSAPKTPKPNQAQGSTAAKSKEDWLRASFQK